MKKLLIFFIFFFVFIWHPPFNSKTYHVYSKLIKLNWKVRNIQNGGCGFFCYYASNYLDSLGIDYQIIGLRNNGNVPQHMMVRTPWGNLDNKGFFSDFAIMVWSFGDVQSISKDELNSMLKNQKWNPKFKQTDSIYIKNIFQ